MGDFETLLEVRPRNGSVPTAAWSLEPRPWFPLVLSPWGTEGILPCTRAFPWTVWLLVLE